MSTAAATPAAKIVGNTATGPTRFYVQKKAVSPMLHAIKGGQQNQYVPPAKGLADRDDVSGKFARKVGQNRRALERIADMMQEERQALVKHHSEKFPEIEIVNGEERPHPSAGKPTPVYATASDGTTPLFKKNKAGHDTEERIVAPDQYNLADPMAFQRDMKELLEEWVVVECPGFTIDDFELFKAVAPRIIDPLMDLEVGGPSHATAEEQEAAYRNTAALYLSLAEKIQPSEDEDGQSLASIAYEKGDDDQSAEDRAAP